MKWSARSFTQGFPDSKFVNRKQ